MDNNCKDDELREKYIREGFDEESVELLLERDRIAYEYSLIVAKIEPLISIEETKKQEINRLNSQICERIGHKLAKEWHLTKRYGKTYNCLACGKTVGEMEICDKDQFFDSEKQGVKKLNFKKIDNFTKPKK